LFTTSLFLCYLTPAYAGDAGVAMEMTNRTVTQPDEAEKWWFQFGPRSGAFAPVNFGLRETYGGSMFFYGMGLTALHQGWGLRVEVEHIDADRLIPLNETNKWRNVQSDLSITPFWVTGLVRLADEPWMTHVGLGGGVVLVGERFRGEAYTDNNDPTIGPTGFAYRYTDFSQTDTLFGFQLVAGFSRHKRFGGELKYSYIPRKGASGFADLGGLSVFLTLSF
jgi:hypothetical protein